MANRGKAGRRRSRKRRAAGAAATSAAVATADAPAHEPSVPARKRPARARARDRSPDASDGGYRAPGSVGERPHAPWHPFPLAELLILVGLVAIAIGAARGEAGLPILFVGVGVVLIGTLDTTIREHLSGYRSHAALLASIPTALFHGGAALALYALGAPRVTWVLVPLAVDVPLFTVLLRLLRARFADARRERVLAGDR